MWCLHTAQWWQRHWERTGIVEVEIADTLPDGWRLWQQWHEVIAPDNVIEIEAIKADGGRYMGYVRVIARKQQNIQLDEPLLSISTEYVKKPVLWNTL